MKSGKTCCLWLKGGARNNADAGGAKSRRYAAAFVRRRWPFTRPKAKFAYRHGGEMAAGEMAGAAAAAAAASRRAAKSKAAAVMIHGTLPARRKLDILLMTFSGLTRTLRYGRAVTRGTGGRYRWRPPPPLPYCCVHSSMTADYATRLTRPALCCSCRGGPAIAIRRRPEIGAVLRSRPTASSGFVCPAAARVSVTTRGYCGLRLRWLWRLADA